VADAKQVLEEAINEAHVLAGTGGSKEDLESLVELAYAAYYSTDGTVPDDVVKGSPLHATARARLGL
jgi:hypothetical protein